MANPLETVTHRHAPVIQQTRYFNDDGEEVTALVQDTFDQQQFTQAQLELDRCKNRRNISMGIRVIIGAMIGYGVVEIINSIANSTLSKQTSFICTALGGICGFYSCMYYELESLTPFVNEVTRTARLTGLFPPHDLFNDNQNINQTNNNMDQPD